jgi:predicted nucleotidyltransferase
MKTSGLADVLRAALLPLEEKIDAAFVYGSIAKGESTAASDVDLMLVGDDVTFGDVVLALGETSKRIGREVNPTIYSRKELRKRIQERNGFVTRVLAGTKIWLIGDDRAISA